MKASDGRLGAHMPFKFQLIYVPQEERHSMIKKAIKPDSILCHMLSRTYSRFGEWVTEWILVWRSTRFAPYFSLPLTSFQLLLPEWPSDDDDVNTLNQNEKLDWLADRTTDSTNEEKMSCCVLNDFFYFSLEHFGSDSFFSFGMRSNWIG